MGYEWGMKSSETLKLLITDPSWYLSGLQCKYGFPPRKSWQRGKHMYTKKEQAFIDGYNAAEKEYTKNLKFKATKRESSPWVKPE